MKHITHTILIRALLFSAWLGASSVHAQTPGSVLTWGSTYPTPATAQSGVTAIAAQSGYAMVLKQDGSVIVWGDYFASNAGLTNVPPAARSGVAAISAGGSHCLALKTNGSVIVWGDWGFDQTNIPVAAQSGVTAIAAGSYHSLVLKTNGSVVAWGNDSQGESTVPAAAQSGVMAIAGGNYISLALKTNGTVVAWGGGMSVPVGLTGVTAIAARGGGAAALKNDGTVVAWPYADVPANVQGRVKAIAGTLVLTTNGTVVAWGDNIFGQTNVPAGLTGVTAIAAGDGFNMALYVPTAPSVTVPPASQTVSAWQSVWLGVEASGFPLNYQWRKDGADIPGQGAPHYYIDYAHTNDSGLYSVVVSNAAGSVTSSPALLTVNPTAPGTVVAWGSGGPPLTGISAIAAGNHHALALRYDGSVVAWGDNNFGQTNVPVAAQTGVMAIGAGGAHSLAVKTNGEVVAWGANFWGETNVPVAAHSGVVAVAGGDSFSAALKNDGSVLVWGFLQQADVPADAHSGVAAIAAGGLHVLALKSNGTTVAWGFNCCGQADIPVEAQSGVIAVATGRAHSLALKTNGAVVAWGENFYGETEVPPDAQSGVVAIAASEYQSLALKSDGTVVAWGEWSFVNGDWEGVTAIAAGGGFGLALLRGAITAPPLLARRLDGNAMLLSWPATATGFTLQSTTNLIPPVTWVDVTNNPPAVIGGQFTVTNTASGGTRFFRLIRP